MTAIKLLFAHVRTAHKTATHSAEIMMEAVTDHDDEYAQITVDALESAAAKLETSARTLREQIAVFNHIAGKSS